MLTGVLLFGCGGAASQKPARIQSYETPGNLKSTNVLSCVRSESITPKHTPADLYPAEAECIRSDNLDAAIDIHAFAASFGAYDTKRVSDPSAHQAIGALQAKYLWDLPPDKKSAFIEHFEASTTRGSESARRLCAELRRVGRPTYEPEYMTQHGMEAVLGNPGGGVPPGFEPDAAWASVLESYMRCER